MSELDYEQAVASYRAAIEIDPKCADAYIGLTILDLDDNQISGISMLADLTNLTYLDLRDNQISDISMLKGLTNLTQLYLSGNPITDYSPVEFAQNLEY